MPAPWSHEKCRRAADLYESGSSQVQVAKILRAGQATVSKVLRRLKVRDRHYWTEEKVDDLVALYAEGAGTAECARQFQTNSETIRRHLLLRGVRLRPQKSLSGDKHWNWKGGQTGGGDGYVYVRAKDHPYRNSQGYVLEHRLVMERSLGRYLLPEEVVHHKNKRKSDNRLENLEVFSSNGEHLAAELKGQVPRWSEDGKRRIAEGVLRASEQRRTAPRPKLGVLQLPSTASQKPLRPGTSAPVRIGLGGVLAQPPTNRPLGGCKRKTDAPMPTGQRP